MKTKKKGTTIKNWNTHTADGTWLDFGDQVNSIEEITPGMTATLISDGANPGGVPNGAYVMPNGATWEFKAGTLTKMGTPAGNMAFYKKGLVVFHQTKGSFKIRVQGNRFTGLKPKTGI